MPKIRCGVANGCQPEVGIFFTLCVIFATAPHILAKWYIDVARSMTQDGGNCRSVLSHETILACTLNPTDQTGLSFGALTV